MKVEMDGFVVEKKYLNISGMRLHGAFGISRNHM